VPFHPVAVLRRRCQAILPQPPFNVAETLHEFPVGALQGRLGIDPSVPGHVREREQEIAHLLLHLGAAAAAERDSQLLELLADFLEDAVGLVPVKTDTRGLGRDAQGLEKRGQSAGYRSEHRGIALIAALLDLDLLPLLQHLGRRRQASLAEDVRVPPHDLVADGAHHGLKIEVACLLRDSGLEHDLEQEIAQLLLQTRGSAARDRLRDLVGLLDDEGRQRPKRLLPVPGTPLRAPQAGHDLTQAIHFRHEVP